MKAKTHATFIALLLLSKIIVAQDTIFMRDASFKIGLVKEISETEVKYKQLDNTNGPNYIINKYEVDKIKYANGKIDVFEYVNPWLRKGSSVQESIVTPVFDSISFHKSQVRIAITQKVNPKSKKPAFYNQDINPEHISVLNPNRFFYKGEVKSKYEIQEIMLKNNDPYIREKIDRARKGEYMRYWAFADIPISLAGFGVLSNALDQGLEGDKLHDKQILSSVLLIAGAACFTIGIYNTAAYKKNTTKAVMRYNQLINQ